VKSSGTVTVRGTGRPLKTSFFIDDWKHKVNKPNS